MRLQNGFFRVNPEELLLYTKAGLHNVLLTAGSYKVTIHGAGGAGGENGQSAGNRSGGIGGAGGVGKKKIEYFTLTSQSQVQIYVGNKGETKANGGNGGAGGTYSAFGSTSYIKGGAGGGGGEPSYVKANDKYYFALGGGGGGGGGGAAGAGRYCPSGGGGGGGGYYRFDSSTGAIISVPGARGGYSGGQDDGEGQQGVTGNTQDFPSIYSGHGGGGDRTVGAVESYGGGAGGGGGGAGAGNHGGAVSGAGGGGAGGDMDAGGGSAGTLAGYVNKAAKNAYNYKTTPTSTTDYKGMKQTTNWGVGGTTNQDGTDGWVFIERV